MSNRPGRAEHPGGYIRRDVIPSGMSITDAAKRLRVGRPALSNLLNGNSSLSPEMALRLERTFGADRQQLLYLQSAFDHHDRREGELSIAVGAYVPAFLTIKARQVHEWAEGNVNARNELPVLLRKLVNSTGRELRQVDFPAYDNAERKGWDGLVEAGAATPWIPEGKSGWEFGTSKRPRTKAENDYANRLKSASPAERKERSFVFVTPRNWPSKSDWVRDKQAAGDWKTVRAFDASDLEQWLELSISGQIWFAERLGTQLDGLETPDRYWEHWSAASDPRITPAIFEPSILTYGKEFKKWLEQESMQPFVVAADSTAEALAFLACLLRHDTIDVTWHDRAVIFESGERLRTLAESTAPFMPIVYTDEAERELATIYRRFHCVVVRPRNAVDSNPHIALDSLNHESFKNAVVEMGIDVERVEQLSRESGRSPTILRRRLSSICAIKRPEWAQDGETARKLIPMALIGAWHSDSAADQEVMEVLSDKDYSEIEEDFSRVLQLNDAPVWSAGQHRGVASKIDCVFAIGNHIIKQDLCEFLVIAEYVLSESDPALQLPEGERWAAALYGKVRNHSAAMREGICETLVILSVHGNNLLRNRLGGDIGEQVSSVIRRLLTPLTLDKLLSQDRDLPHYAEAAPDVFLDLLEADLQKSEPVAIGLLKPTEAGPFGACPRSGLLWALECLGWKNLGRVSRILAQLSRTGVDDNWVHKPIASLEALYRAWMPQTAARLEERVTSLEVLTKGYPDIGWSICMEEIEGGHRFGNSSYRPRWRSDATGVGQPLRSADEIHTLMRRALDLALDWSQHDETTLGDLVERMDAIPHDKRLTVWNLIDKWAQSDADENAKARLSERIRRFALTRRGGGHRLEENIKNRARKARENLQSDKPVTRHAWLFASHWIEFSADEIEDTQFDYEEHERKIHECREAAIQEIWVADGFEGVLALLRTGGAADVVGGCLAQIIADEVTRNDLVLKCLFSSDGERSLIDRFIGGFLSFIEDESRSKILITSIEGLGREQTVRLLTCAPFKEATWRILDQYDEEHRDSYWLAVSPVWRKYNEKEVMELIDRLLQVKRPRAAFHAVHLEWKRVETSRLKRLLNAVATVDDEPADQYRLSAHHISEGLESLDGRAGVSPDEMAQLEFLYVRILDRSKHGIPNLERQITKSPAAFVQLLSLAFGRQDEAEDPPEWRIDDTDKRAALASAAHSALHQMKLLPGTGADGIIDNEELFDWIVNVRDLCQQYGRREIGDEYLGQVLARAPGEEDGMWPCLSVCDVMERIASPKIAAGFQIGVYNSRGVHWRGEGGGQERELAAKYRMRSNQLAFEYPHVSSVIEGIAAGYDRDAAWHDEQAQINKRHL